MATSVHLEDAPDHIGLMLDDPQATRFSRYRLISICLAPGARAGGHPTGHAAPDLVCEVLEVESADEPSNADLYGVGTAIMNGADFDPKER